MKKFIALVVALGVAASVAACKPSAPEKCDAKAACSAND